MRWYIAVVLFIALFSSAIKSQSTEERNKFALYFGAGSFQVFNVGNGVNLLDSQYFDRSKKTVIYIHGYIETPDSISVKTIVNAYLKRADYNFILLDWHEDASGNYFNSALPKSAELGTVVAKQILNMVEAGLNVETLHLVGHSTGGQIAGHIGREVKTKSNGRVYIRRISALDPAFPGFYGLNRQHISANDAEFVDVIHTDAWLYGAPRSTGTVDFWPNKGETLQPGCPKRNYQPLTENDLCSHWRSWYYWAESVAKQYSEPFYAVPAKNWNDFKNGNVGDFDPNAVMGNDASPRLVGNYYLTTNDHSPFARGRGGIIYLQPTMNRQTLNVEA